MEHRNVAKQPLALLPAAFSMPKNPNGSLVLGRRYLSYKIYYTYHLTF